MEKAAHLVDVRSPQEFTGEVLAPPGLPETCQRSSHTWCVLKYLLGYPKVRNYDGSWTEWGNLVGAPVERTAAIPGR